MRCPTFARIELAPHTAHSRRADLFPICCRTNPQSQIGKLFAISSCRVSWRRVPQSPPAPPPIAQSAPETAKHSHSPSPPDGRISHSLLPRHARRKSRSSASASFFFRARCTSASTAPPRAYPATGMDRSEICRLFFHPHNLEENDRHHRARAPCPSASNHLSRRKRIPQLRRSLPPK